MFDFLSIITTILIVLAIARGLWGAAAWGLTHFFRGHCNICGKGLDQNGNCEICELRRKANRKPNLQDDLLAFDRILNYAQSKSLWNDDELQTIQQSIEKLKPKTLTNPQAKVFELKKQEKQLPEQPPPNPSVAIQTSLNAERKVQADTIVEFEPIAKSQQAETQQEERVLAHTNKQLQNDVPAPVPPQSMRDWFLGMMLAFMEKSNIRWIEIIAASMIVFCSIGLVISLWSTLAATNRFFPSIVFMLITVGVHAAGHYTLRKWKLQTTSRGILHVGLMLIPLSVITGMLLVSGKDGVRIDFPFLIMLLIGANVYGSLAVFASRSLFTTAWLPVAVSTIVSGLSLVAIRIGYHPGSSPLPDSIWLLPTLAITALFGVIASASATLRVNRTFCFYRRHLGIGVQLLFAALAVVVFWLFLRGIQSQLKDWDWAILGTSGSVWALWGAVHSRIADRLDRWLRKDVNPKSNLAFPKRDSGNEASSAVIASWLIGILFAGFTAWSFWQISGSRLPLVVLTGLVGVWQSLFGLITRSPRAMSGGSIAALFAQTLLIETAYASPLPMLWHYWFSWERVLTLSALGGIALVLGRLLGMIWNAQRAIQQSWPWWVFGIAMGVGLIILVGYFEKNRSKFLGMYQSLKEWQV